MGNYLVDLGFGGRYRLDVELKKTLCCSCARLTQKGMQERL